MSQPIRTVGMDSDSTSVEYCQGGLYALRVIQDACGPD